MKKVLSLAVSLSAVLATSAFAQEVSDDPVDESAREAVKETKEEAKDEVRDSARDAAEAAALDVDRDTNRRRGGRTWTYPPSRVGMEVQIGGGGQTFLDNDATSVAKPGGDWTARFIVGTRSFIAGEAAYLGSAQNLDTLGVSDQAVLLSNGFEAAFRVNFTRAVVQPYALAGYTWRRYEVTNTAVNTSSVAEADNVNAIPVGIGLAIRPGRFVIDFRATFHGAFGEELIPNANLSTLSGNAKVGFEF